MSDQQETTSQTGHRVLFVGKYGLDDSAGNAVAIRRLTAAFEERGTAVRYVQAGESPGDAAFALFGFTPTVIHALHAGAAARLGEVLARALDVPLVVTVTGTDLNLPAEAGGSTLARLQAADAIVALTQLQLDQLRELVPDHLTLRIPQSVELGDETFELREALEHAAGPALATRRIALLAGGLRPVKGQTFALEAFERAGASLDDWLLVLAGPVLDAEYAAEVRERARALPGAVYIGEIPHDAMRSAMAACDVLLNSSESEGEAQIILEAQVSSLPVIARRVVGNTALVEDGVTGWLFDDYTGLSSLLESLAQHPERLTAMAASARAERLDRLDVGLEAAAHLELYDQLTRPGR